MPNAFDGNSKHRQQQQQQNKIIHMRRNAKRNWISDVWSVKTSFFMSNYIREDEDDLRYSSLGFCGVFFSSCFKVKLYAFDVPHKVNSFVRAWFIETHTGLTTRKYEPKSVKHKKNSKKKKQKMQSFKGKQLPKKKKRFQSPFLLWLVPMFTGIVTDTQNSSIDWHLTTDLFMHGNNVPENVSM